MSKDARTVLQLLPHPKQFTPGAGVLGIEKRVPLDLPADMDTPASLFKDGPLARFKPAPSARGRAKFRHPDEYRLEVRREGVAIDGNTARACYYALVTLKQLAQNHPQIPCGVIRDWPDTPWRGYHLDCKGGFPPLKGLYAFAQKLLDLKFNCFLIEYEDRFPYRSVPQVPLPGSPSLNEWREFLAFLRANHAKPIPLVQTGGHLEFLLKHRKYAALRENGNVNELCLSNPKARAVVFGMLDEVMDLHAGDDIFHIGADETWHMGTCPVCQARLAKGLTRLDLYTEHVGAVARHVIARGFRPMMWCDMFWRGETPEDVTKLPKETILAEWVYSGERDGAPGCYWAGKYVGTDRYNELHPDRQRGLTQSSLDAKARAFLGRYWPMDAKTGLGPVSPYIEFFHEKGYEVWGMSATRAGEPGRTFGLSLKSRVENVLLWAKTAKQHKLPGTVCTSWSRSAGMRPLYGPWDGPWEAILAAAQQDWDAATPYEKLPGLIGRQLYGAEAGAEVETIIDHIDRIFTCTDRTMAAMVRGAVAGIRAKAARGQAHLDLLDLWARFQEFRAWAESALVNIENQLWRVPRGMLAERGHGNREEMLKGAQAIADRFAAFREEMRKGLTPHFRPEDLEEYLAARFDDLSFRLKNATKALKG